jgi:hypothetical protein
MYTVFWLAFLTHLQGDRQSCVVFFFAKFLLIVQRSGWSLGPGQHQLGMCVFGSWGLREGILSYIGIVFMLHVPTGLSPAPMTKL